MHELAITEEILRITVEHAEKAQAERVTDIHLVIGDLSSVVDDSVQFYFDFLTKDTLAQGAQLHFERIAPRARCYACGTEYTPPDSRLWTCPECEALGGEVIAGKEFYVASIEVE